LDSAENETFPCARASPLKWLDIVLLPIDYTIHYGDDHVPPTTANAKQKLWDGLAQQYIVASLNQRVGATASPDVNTALLRAHSLLYCQPSTEPESDQLLDEALGVTAKIHVWNSGKLDTAACRSMCESVSKQISVPHFNALAADQVKIGQGNFSTTTLAIVVTIVAIVLVVVIIGITLGVRKRRTLNKSEGSFSQQQESEKERIKRQYKQAKEVYMDPLVLSDTLPITEQQFQKQQQQGQHQGQHQGQQQPGGQPLHVETETMQMTEEDEALYL
jgi:hypothetical protein